jgi:hypothetical protein
MATEKQYDELIAPKLLEIADLCRELGMSIVARVEWAPAEIGITQVVPETAGVGQKLTQLAAHAKGNVDALCISLLRRLDCSQSIFLQRYMKGASDAG